MARKPPTKKPPLRLVHKGEPQPRPPREPDPGTVLHVMQVMSDLRGAADAHGNFVLPPAQRAKASKIMDACLDRLLAGF